GAPPAPAPRGSGGRPGRGRAGRRRRAGGDAPGRCAPHLRVATLGPCACAQPPWRSALRRPC
ncbi:MAG: hypothetical protein ACK56I_04800, partial [bacterium]